jgi:hypothetical protein
MINEDGRVKEDSKMAQIRKKHGKKLMMMI